jgi:peptidoglycan/xylan/chitin deacetylase (PgdA/CDA1 family)
MKPYSVPVLTYHSMNISGRSYSTNDHLALASDLWCMHDAGFEIVRLNGVLCESAHIMTTRKRKVALTFDDGSWFDWHDLEHPTHGMQRSFANILRDFAGATGAYVHATSFVIVDPTARRWLDKTCMIGRGWWGDEWWGTAESEGLIDVESHSWDHNHETLPPAIRIDPVGGRFDHIDSGVEARRQIADSIAWLNENVCRRSNRLLAWPYGQSSEYLRSEWLPAHANASGLLGAFGTRPAPMTDSSPRWDLPRFVCGRDWRTPAELLALLDS